MTDFNELYANQGKTFRKGNTTLLGKTLLSKANIFAGNNKPFPKGLTLEEEMILSREAGKKIEEYIKGWNLIK